MMSLYEYELIDSVQLCDPDHLTRLATVYSLFCSNDLLEILTRVEKKALDEIDNLDEFHLTNIVRAFTRTRGVKHFGKDSTFVALEQKIMKKFDNFDFKSLSYIMHAYGIREQGNPDFHAKFLAKIKSLDELMDYQVLSNVVYYLMFTDNTDKDVWIKIMKNVFDNPKVIPIRYYRPLKMSKYYIKHHFPEIDLTDYSNKFFYPERYFNASHREEKAISKEEKQDFMSYMVKRLYLMPVHY